MKNDPVNHPSHYTQHGIECIDAIEARCGEDWLVGQVIKYIWRYKDKGDVLIDLHKAQFYLNRLIKLVEREMN